MVAILLIGCLLILAVGFQIGKKIMNGRTWLSILIGAAGMGAVTAYILGGMQTFPDTDIPVLPPNQLEQHMYFGMYAFGACALLTFSMWVGASEARQILKKQSQLLLWKERLAMDEHAGGNPLRIAIDCQKIGDLHMQLRNYGSALFAYERAYPILKIELADHPELRTFLLLYASALRHMKCIEEANQVTKEADAVKC